MKVWIVPLALLLVLTVGCGGSSGTQTTSSQISGAYEFVVSSNITGSTTVVEANMAANGTQSNASGPDQVQVLTLEKKNWYVNGICPGATPGQNSVTADLNDSNISLTLDDGGNSLPVQGVLAGATISGNYSVTGSSCPNLTGLLGYTPGSDSGGVVGNQVPDLAGTFSGTLNLPNGTDNVALTLAEDSGTHVLTVSGQFTGPVDNGPFTLTGSAVGNVMFVSGSVNGPLSLFGYFDKTGSLTGVSNSMMVFDYANLNTAGLLFLK